VFSRIDKMEHKILIAGFGGQGVVFAGKLLASIALKENKHVAVFVSYGAEVRGGTANSALTISDKEIDNPIIDKPTIAMMLNEPSLDRFEQDLGENAFLILNDSLIKRDLKRNDLKITKVPATETATRLGNTKIANVVALGALIKKTGIVKLGSALETLAEVLKGKENIIEINKKALQEGYDSVD